MEHLTYVGFDWDTADNGEVGRHYFPARIAKGATVGYTPSEGIGNLNSSAVFKNQPRRNTAWLMARWLASKEGQRVYAQGGHSPSIAKSNRRERPNRQ